MAGTNERPVALVTGASSGLGAAFAERLAREGYDLIVAARRGERLEDLRERLEKNEGIKVDVMVADLANSSDLRLVEERAANESRLELLVNNAGFAGYMPVIELGPDRAEELIKLQVLAVVRLTHAALSGMLGRGRGAIINVSSRLGFSAPLGSDPLPKRATYAGSKAFVITFTELLHSELKGTGVQVQALCPGLVDTEFHERARIDRSRLTAAVVTPPGDIVEASLAGLRLGEVICIPTMEDASLLAAIEESEKRFFENTRTGQIALRYRENRPG